MCCRLTKAVTIRTVWKLQLSLVFCPNICMFFAFIFWGLTEERLQVSGSDETTFASVGEDVTLNCFVDSHIPPEHIEKVLWMKTEEDEGVVVHLYQNNEILPDSSDEQYRDRVEFFTDEIPKGNLSLRLKSVRTEDKGVYMCQVFAGGLSVYVNVVLELLDTMKKCIRFSTITREYAIFTIIVYSGFFTYGWEKSKLDNNMTSQVISGICFGIVLMFSVILCGGFTNFEVKRFFFIFLPVSQVNQLSFSLRFSSRAFAIVSVGQTLVLMCISILPFLKAKLKNYYRRWIIVTLLLLDLVLMICAHIGVLKKEEDYMGWISVILFLQVLRMIVIFEDGVLEAKHSRVQMQQQQAEMSQQGSNALLLCNFIMYMFGAVGLVLLNSVTLTAELILKARNGQRVIKDLRVIVFFSECVFAWYWLVLHIFAFWKVKVRSEQAIQSRHIENVETVYQTQNQRKPLQRRRRQTRNEPSEFFEMEILCGPDTDISERQEQALTHL